MVRHNLFSLAYLPKLRGMESIAIKFNNGFSIHGINVDCDIEIKRGNIHHIHGENGIGKSSLLQYLKLNHLSHLLGVKTIFVDQFPLRPLNEISFLDLVKILESERSENLELYDEKVSLLKEFEKFPIKNLSGGQNQLVKIFLSLYISGEIFFFDEPLQYLDSDKVALFKEIIGKLKELGKTVIIIEHRKEILENLVDHHLMVEKKQGKIIEVRNINGN